MKRFDPTGDRSMRALFSATATTTSMLRFGPPHKTLPESLTTVEFWAFELDTGQRVVLEFVPAAEAVMAYSPGGRGDALKAAIALGFTPETVSLIEQQNGQ